VLDTSYLDRGRPLGEARLLYEIGPSGASVRALRARLGLDSGYVSRLLRSLERQGLIRLGADPADARVRHARLTRAGRRELTAYDRLSDRLADSMLSPLRDGERARLVAAMGEVERLLRAAAVTIEEVSASSAAARACVAAYVAELAARFETGFDPAKANPASEAEMSAPDGAFFLARLDGEAVGCAGLRRMSAEIAEVKRMWTAPAARGLGIARRLLAAIEDRARAMGAATLRLETNKALVEAQALYRAAGFREVAPFNTELYAHHWFAKRL
jgi:DNA-binding MarR family transcriptional regulator/GNAT superfamily N-acetyltransferase